MPPHSGPVKLGAREPSTRVVCRLIKPNTGKTVNLIVSAAYREKSPTSLPLCGVVSPLSVPRLSLKAACRLLQFRR